MVLQKTQHSLLTLTAGTSNLGLTHASKILNNDIHLSAGNGHPKVILLM